MYSIDELRQLSKQDLVDTICRLQQELETFRRHKREALERLDSQMEVKT